MDNFSEPIRTRFWAKVEKTDGCWNWIGARTQTGYGRFSIRTSSHIVSYRAHRYAWIAENGPIPSDKELCHRCDNTLCVRPDHIFLGTHQENMADASAKGRLYTAPERPHLPTRGPEFIELEDGFFDEAGLPSDSGRDGRWGEDVFDQLLD